MTSPVRPPFPRHRVLFQLGPTLLSLPLVRRIVLRLQMVGIPLLRCFVTTFCCVFGKFIRALSFMSYVLIAYRKMTIHMVLSYVSLIAYRKMKINMVLSFFCLIAYQKITNSRGFVFNCTPFVCAVGTEWNVLYSRIPTTEAKKTLEGVLRLEQKTCLQQKVRVLCVIRF